MAGIGTAVSNQSKNNKDNSLTVSTTASQTAGKQETNKLEQKDTENKDINKKTKTVVLKATASGNGFALWSVGSSTNTKQFDGTFEKSLELKPGDHVSLIVSGDITGSDEQKMTCEIVLDGESADEQEATGSIGSAHCSKFIL